MPSFTVNAGGVKDYDGRERHPQGFGADFGETSIVVFDIRSPDARLLKPTGPTECVFLERVARRTHERPPVKIKAEVLPVGDAAVLAVLGDNIDQVTMRNVWLLADAIGRLLRNSVLDVVPAYGSVLVRFDPATVQLAAVMACVRGAMETVVADGKAAPASTLTSRTIEVGVCFAPEHALDLGDVAARLGMSSEDIIREFCQPTYHVAFLGFTAGFPYLVGLPEKLSFPRLPSPRVRVPAGSVGIAGGQCGIYPRTSPGGWRILGKTNAAIFDPAREGAALFRRGDAVRFRAVASLDAAVANVS